MSLLGEPFRTTSQSVLPPSAYFDESIFSLEMELLFGDCSDLPRYIGHELLTPNPGDYYVLPEDCGLVLVRTENGIELLSNVCRHRHAILLQGRGNTKRIVCPAHKWTYSTAGELLATPNFSPKPRVQLEKNPLQSWNGLLFKCTHNVMDDFSDVDIPPLCNFSGFVLDRVEVVEYSYNWKIWIENSKDEYHIDVFHPGLSKFIDTHSLHYSFGHKSAIHAFDLKALPQKNRSRAYQKWQDEILKYANGETSRFSIVWLYCYPNVVVEWYPYFAVIWKTIPLSASRTATVSEYYFPKEITAGHRDLINAAYAAYAESTAEDDVLVKLMHQGLESLYRRKIRQTPVPYHQPLERGNEHFHAFLRRRINYEKL